MNSKRARSQPINTSGSVRLNGSGWFEEVLPSDSLPMGTGKRGRKPKGESPFTKNFVNLLKEKKCSHRKAAEIAGVAPSVISNWTAGSTPNNLAALLRLTEALGADFQFILTGIRSDAVPIHRLGEIFEVEDQPNLTGIFQMEIRRLKLRR